MRPVAVLLCLKQMAISYRQPKNQIVIQQLLLNQTGILHTVVPYIWDPFGNSTVFGLQPTTGSYKSCTSALGANY